MDNLRILEQKLFDQPLNYPLHVEYINALLENSSDKILSAYENFSKRCCLTRNHWFDWIKLVSSDAEKTKELIGRALDDFPGMIDVWKFCFELMIGQKSSKESIMGLFNRFLRISSYNNMKSHQIFTLVLHWMDELDEESSGDERLRIMETQLMRPSFNLSTVWYNYTEEQEDEEMKKKYERIYQYCEKIREDETNFEQSVSGPNPSLSSFIPYLEHRMSICDNDDSNGIPLSKEEFLRMWLSRTIELFERCLIHHPFQSELWYRYIYFLQKHVRWSQLFPFPRYVMSVCNRSVRCCTYETGLWMLLFEAKIASYLGKDKEMEMVHKTYEQISEVIGFMEPKVQPRSYSQHFFKYCSYLRSKISNPNDDVVNRTRFFNTSQQCLVVIRQFFPLYRDPGWNLVRLIGNTVGLWNPLEGRKVFEKELFSPVLVKNVRKDLAEFNTNGFFSLMNFWIMFENRVRPEGYVVKIREVYRRSIQVFPDPTKVERIGNSWVYFEKSLGGGEEVEVRKVEGKEEEEEEEEEVGSNGETNIIFEIRRIVFERLRVIREKFENDPRRKRKKNKSKKKKKKAPPPSDENAKITGKKRKRGENEEEGKEEEIGTTEQPPPPEKKRKLDGEKKVGGGEEEKEEEEKEEEDKKKKKKNKIRGPGVEELTCFAWSLPLDLTEEELRGLFLGCLIRDVRMIRGRDNEFKGYAYVEMEDQVSYEKGLLLDNTQVKDKEIRVVRSRTQSERRQRNERFRGRGGRFRRRGRGGGRFRRRGRGFRGRGFRGRGSFRGRKQDNSIGGREGKSKSFF